MTGISRREFIVGTAATAIVAVASAPVSAGDENVAMYEAWDIADDNSGTCVISFMDNGVVKIFDVRKYDCIPFIFLGQRRESFLQRYWLSRSELKEFLLKCGPWIVLP